MKRIHKDENRVHLYGLNVLLAFFLAGCLSPASTSFTSRVVAHTTTPIERSVHLITETDSANEPATATAVISNGNGGESVTRQPHIPLQDSHPTHAAAPPPSETLRPSSPMPIQVFPTPTAPQNLTQSDVPTPVDDLAYAAQAIIDLSNQQRTLFGLAPFGRDETIMAIARKRLNDMIARSYFSHYDPLTGAALAREAILASGYSRGGENIYWSGSVELPDFPGRAIDWFMADPPHAAGILSTSYSLVGVGVAWNGQGWMVVQNFATP